MTSCAKSEKLCLLCAALGTALVCAVAMLRYSGEQQFYFLYYNVPIAAPFSAFVLERLLRRRGLPLAVFDVGVVSLALTRAVFPVPGYSGHVLFLLYALFSGRSKSVRVLSALVLAQVLVVKFAFWNDFVTPAGAAAIAALALVVRAKLESRTPSASLEVVD
jgi:hypothetical protein